VARGISFAIPVAAALGLAACASASRAGAAFGVTVYRTPAGNGVRMPSGCRLLGESGSRTMSESDLDGPGAFSGDLASAAAAGANVLLSVETMISPRRDFDCAAAQPISDCPGTLGAWYRVVLRSYACDDAARRTLATPSAP